MARQITKEIVKAFLNDEHKKVNNSKVVTDYASTRMYLFNNLIAIKTKSSGKIEISMAGYPTTTTRERLNGIPGVSLTQKNYKQYLNGQEIETDKFYVIN